MMTVSTISSTDRGVVTVVSVPAVDEENLDLRLVRKKEVGRKIIDKGEQVTVSNGFRSINPSDLSREISRVETPVFRLIHSTPGCIPVFLSLYIKRATYI